MLVRRLNASSAHLVCRWHACSGELACYRYFSYTRPVLLSVTGADGSFPYGSTVTVTAQLTALTNSTGPLPLTPMQLVRTMKPERAMWAARAHRHDA